MGHCDCQYLSLWQSVHSQNVILSCRAARCLRGGDGVRAAWKAFSNVVHPSSSLSHSERFDLREISLAAGQPLADWRCAFAGEANDTYM